MEKRTGAADPDEKIRGMRWECVRTEQRCGDEYRAAGGRGNQGGGEDLCWYSASSALTHHHSPGKHMGGFLYSHKTRSGLVWFWSMFPFFLFSVRIVTIQGLVRDPNSGTEVGQISAASAHTHTHKLNRSSSSFSRYHPQFALWISRTYEPLMSSVRLFVMGALQRRCCVLICSGDDSPWMRWSGLWDVCLSHSHSVGVRKQHQLQLVVFSFYSRDAVNL